MASVYGLELKNCKTYEGPEGPATQGDLFLRGKKIGFWSEDPNGGCPDLTIEKGFSEKKLAAALAKRRPDRHETYTDASGKEFADDYDIDDAAYDIICMQDYEKEFRKACGKGKHAIFLITDGWHVVSWGLGEAFDGITFDQIRNVLKDEIEKAKKENDFFETKEYKEFLFRSKQDFNIGSDNVITLEEIAD